MWLALFSLRWKAALRKRTGPPPSPSGRLANGAESRTVAGSPRWNADASGTGGDVFAARGEPRPMVRLRCTTGELRTRPLGVRRGPGPRRDPAVSAYRRLQRGQPPGR